ncbi:adenylate/guanylate cyclase domain-containing protein [Cohnella fermenti]|uniref:HAMP domain-containing protein n=1 Tax=Cohnella fermenti TaxID=2565925 RepID=A0A4S4BG51_9BACL|nr:adenylate/guanylate cyclase domain-containing protein [Cohnella fermenti]THF73396.1 HAMP domain-containing protein [Cohnella fermenti]
MKGKLIALLLAVVVGALSLVTLREHWTVNPFANEAAYTYISRVATDSDGAIYAITDSKKAIRKTNASGKLIYSVSSADDADPNTITLYSSISADEAGNAYALETILDSYGLRVYGDRIVRISPDGSRIEPLYSTNYEAADNLLRVGNIQSLSVKDGFLYFFRKDTSSASLLKLPTDIAGGAPQQPEVVRTTEMANNRYLNEMTGNDENQFFFTSKRGRLFKAENGEVVQLYPAKNAETQLNFPVGIVAEGSYVYFIDYHDAAVKRLDAGKPESAPETFLTFDQLTDIDPKVEWSDFTSLTATGDRIIVATGDQIVALSPAGDVLSYETGYHYPQSDMWLKLGYWLLIVAEAVLAVTFLRLVYVHLFRRRVFLLLKQLALIIPVVLLFMAGLSYSVSHSVSAEIKKNTDSQLKLLAGNGRYLVSGDNLEKLNSPKDFRNEDYLTIKQRLNGVFSQNGESRDGLYNTIYRYMDGKLYIIMDDDDSVTMFQPFPVSEDNIRVLQEGVVVSGEWEDSTGQWMYALGPLYNSEGDIVGIYETGKDMTGISKSTSEIVVNILNIIAIIGLVLLFVITLMTVYLLSSIRKLRRSVNLIASGEWDVKVQIRTRDEVEELGERFNMMASSIRQYIQEMTKLSNSYFRFVPQPFLKVLGKKNMTQISLGEQTNRRMTMLVCNMRQFTEFSKTLTTDENFRFINSFLKEFGPAVREYGGFTSRYLGPGMLSMFPGEPGEALKAAIKLRETLETYNRKRGYSGYEPIEIGIAVHTADVMLGIIGEEQRLEGSVVSTAVELTLELEKLSGKLGVNVLLTEDSLRSMKKLPPGSYRKLGSFQMGEEQQTIELFDVFEGDSEHIRKLKQETKEPFERAVELFRSGRFYDAREVFVAVVKKNRYDLAAKLYFFECDRYFQEGVSEQWNNALKIS